MKDFLANEIANIEDHLTMVEPKDRLDFIVKLLPYTLPRYELVSGVEESKNESKQLFDKINQGCIDYLSRLDGSYRNKTE